MLDTIEVVGAGFGCRVMVDVLRSRPRGFLLVGVFAFAVFVVFALAGFGFPRVKVGWTTVTLTQAEDDFIVLVDECAETILVDPVTFLAPLVKVVVE